MFIVYIQHIIILESKYGRKMRFQRKKARRGRKEMRLWKGEKWEKTRWENWEIRAEESEKTSCSLETDRMRCIAVARESDAGSS